MLYFLGQLGDSLAAFNVFRYITFRTAGAVVTALFFVFLFGPGMISALRIRQGGGQPIREDGPQGHLLTKKGTPTMGGLMILSGAVISILLWSNLSNVYVWAVLFVTISFGAIGFYDDYLKVTKMSHKGFSGRQRLLIEAVVALIAAYVMAAVTDPNIATQLMFPFIKGSGLPLSYFFYIFAAFIIVGAGNSVNFTDGLDGLAIVPVMVAAASFASFATSRAASIRGTPLPDSRRANDAERPSPTPTISAERKGAALMPCIMGAKGQNAKPLAVAALQSMPAKVSLAQFDRES